MSMQAENPRAVPGSNQAPDYAQTVTDQMARDYAESFRNADELVTEAEGLPDEIDGPETKSLYTRLIKLGRDANARLKAYHAKEKEPFHRGGQAVDTSFFSRMDKLCRRDKHAKPGIIDVLNQRLTDYDNRVLAEERAARQREADRAAKIEADARAAAAKAEEDARLAAEAAERARKPEHIETKTTVAETKAVEADTAKVDVLMATDKADAAALATKAKPADIMRTRDATHGTLSTMTTEKFADILDRVALVQNPAIWPFIPLPALQQALNAYAASVSHSSDAAFQIAGAKFGKRPKSVVR